MSCLHERIVEGFCMNCEELIVPVTEAENTILLLALEDNASEEQVLVALSVMERMKDRGHSLFGSKWTEASGEYSG